MDEPYNVELARVTARWNLAFTLISIIHGAFLGAFLSRIDYSDSLWAMIGLPIVTLAFTAALMEAYGLGITQVANELKTKHGKHNRLLFSFLFFPIAPGGIIRVSEQSEVSLQYANLSALVMFSWFAGSFIVSFYLASEVRKSKTEANDQGEIAD